MGMDPSVLEHVYVAGGIGSGINMKNAVTIGILPDIDLDRFSYIGNSSLSGAYAMLTSTQSRQKVDGAQFVVAPFDSVILCFNKGFAAFVGEFFHIHKNVPPS
jgi:uncharacterized 2Fe-2S/4Fe-4S cluster protein (DUF4445 family)